MEEQLPNQTLDNLLQNYLNSLNNFDPKETMELEIRFGTGRNMIPVSKIQYDDVIKRLLSSGFEISNSSDLLRINSEFMDAKTGITKMGGVRVELEGLGNISKYCKINSLDHFVENNSINFVQKNLVTPEKGKALNILDVPEYNFRTALNLEKNMNDSKLARSMTKDWKNNKKEFRFLKRYSLTNSNFPLKVEVSIVKQTQRKGKLAERSYDFVDSNVMNSPERYEIEIEIDNTKVGYQTSYETSEKLMKPLKRCIMLILSGLQQTNFPTSYVVQKNILGEYMQILHKDKYISDKPILPKQFVGPSSIALQVNNISPINPDSNIPNIRENYTVTDKADGQRKLLFISKEKGLIYLIDTNMNVQFTGARTKDVNLYNSIVDGEHIVLDKNKNYINLYAAFDIYYINKVDVREKSFIGNEKDENNYRLGLLNKFIKELKPVGLKNDVSPIRIQMKTFVSSSSKQTIFEACNYLTKVMKEYEYETDGLIFTPMDTGVGSDRVGKTTPPIKVTWDRSFKWKPPEFNTIDFLISIQKNKNGKDNIKNIFENGLDLSSAVQITQYKTLILRVGFNEGSNGHGYLNPCESILENKVPNDEGKDRDNNYHPVQFFPTNPIDNSAGICNLILEPSDGENMALFTENREIIEDNMIVEFRYNVNKELNWRWEPLRVRYDKTTELRNGGKNFGNAFHVANSNWHSIHNPVTEEMLNTGENIPNELGDDDVYYNRVSKSSLTRSLRDFHNLYVKRKLILGISRPGNTLIDFAVGMGGDIPKWIEAKLNFVFGIDISPDNINNRMNGACARYLNYKKKFKVIPSGLFVTGDSSKNIRNLDAIETQKDKEITNAVFGNGAKNKAELKEGVYNQFGKGEKGFNISSIQFAIHYMFENETTLNNFLRNVSETTVVGGYFIGTCFDGRKIFNYLKDIKKGETKEIRENEKKIWGITKQFDRNDFPPNESSVGYGVDIYMESINKVFREYLVNFEYLNRLMENYGFEVLKPEEAKNIGLPSGIGTFKDLFGLLKEEINKNSSLKNNFGSALSMNDKEKLISFFNNYFIYKKIRDLSNPEATVASIIEPKIETELETDLTEKAKEIVEEIQSEKTSQVKKIKKKIRLKM